VSRGGITLPGLADRHDVEWVRLFGMERPVSWTDCAPHAPAAGTSSGPAGLTSPDGPAPAAAPATSM